MIIEQGLILNVLYFLFIPISRNKGNKAAFLSVMSMQLRVQFDLFVYYTKVTYYL
jgi:hypothetical protein